jgi:hypothetical protein
MISWWKRRTSRALQNPPKKIKAQRKALLGIDKHSLNRKIWRKSKHWNNRKKQKKKRVYLRRKLARIETQS